MIDLYNIEHRYFTIRFNILFTAVSICSSTVYILTPFLLVAQDKGFVSFLYINFAELVAVFILYNFIDNRNLGGRKRIIIFSLIFMTISLGLVYYDPNRLMVIGLSSYKFFVSFLLPSLVVYTNESYTT